MKELEILKKEASNLALPNSRNKSSLAIKLLYPHIEEILQIGVFKKDIWRVLVECNLFTQNSYSSFTRILNKVVTSRVELEKTPVLAAKTPVTNKTEPKKEEAKPKTETEEKPRKPIWANKEVKTPSFVYNPIPRPDISK